MIWLLLSCSMNLKALEQTLEITPAELEIPTSTDRIEQGEHLGRDVLLCRTCHGEDFGGGVPVDVFPAGTIVAPNLTAGAGGVGGVYTDADWIRAIRHGVDLEGRPLVYMPSHDYAALTRYDLENLIAWLRTLPPVDRELPETRLGPGAKRLLLLGGSGRYIISADYIDHDTGPPAAIGNSPASQGEYLARIGGCLTCHGGDLSGSNVGPGLPYSSNITPDKKDGIGAWSEEEFLRAMRVGRRPDDSPIHPVMPWEATASWSDAELAALWRYLQTVTPVDRTE